MMPCAIMRGPTTVQECTYVGPIYMYILAQPGAVALSDAATRLRTLLAALTGLTLEHLCVPPVGGWVDPVV